jgi:serine/threonine-protein kinase
LPPPPKPPGFLKVLVEPWADVYVDGKLIDTTPFARGLSIPEGEHKVELKNPFYVDETRKIVIKRGATEILKVALAKK